MVNGNKYYEFNKDILNLCKEYGLIAIAGKVIALELHRGGEVIKATREILMSSAHFKKLMEISSQLDGSKYRIEAQISKVPNMLSIYRRDILASSIFNIMSEKTSEHNPKITIIEIDDKEEFAGLKDGKLTEIEYMGSSIYIKGDITGHIVESLHCNLDEKINVYQIYSEEINSEVFFGEVKKKGYLSKGHKAKYNEQRKWTKNEKKPTDKLYAEYEKALLECELQRVD